MRAHLFMAFGLALLFALPVRAAEPEPPPAPPMPRVTVSFSGADLIETLYHLFLGTGLRYEAPPNTPDTFSANFEGLPLEKALRILLEPKGFQFTREGDLYRVSRRDDYHTPAERLAQDDRERQRRYNAAAAQRRPAVEPRSRTRFLYGPGMVGITPRAVVGMPSGNYINGSGALAGAVQAVRPGGTTPVTRQRGSRSLSIGPFKIPVPDGFQMLPGGGFELSIPAEGDTEVSGPLGTYTIPFTSPGITIRRR